MCVWILLEKYVISKIMHLHVTGPHQRVRYIIYDDRLVSKDFKLSLYHRRNSCDEPL